MNEISQMEEIARKLSECSTLSYEKAEALIDKLRKTGITPDQLKELVDDYANGGDKLNLEILRASFITMGDLFCGNSKCRYCKGSGYVQIAPNVKGIKKCPYCKEIGGLINEKSKS